MTWQYPPGSRVALKPREGTVTAALEAHRLGKGIVQRTYRPEGCEWVYDVEWNDGTTTSCVAAALEPAERV